MSKTTVPMMKVPSRPGGAGLALSPGGAFVGRFFGESKIGGETGFLL